MRKVSIIFGTRPEAIKMAPIILAMKAIPRFNCRVCVTGQHRQMLDQVLEVFGITPDVDLNLMQANQTLGGLTSRAIAAIDQYLTDDKPDLVLVQGDTTTVLCAALAAFYHRIPVGHVEAGLRTGNMQAPWPEEANRVLATRLASRHFAPTMTSRDNLLKEGVAPNTIFVTGNTVIDALMIAVAKVKANPPEVPGLAPAVLADGKKMVLITGHRRENFGGGFESICSAIAELADRFPDVNFVYPVHLNPNVREPVMRILGNSAIQNPISAIRNPISALPNVHLIEPQTYLPFVRLMNRSTIILTDSGGVQEEAPSLGKPVLVMRDTTERPEAAKMGTVKLVGTSSAAILDGVSTLLTDPVAYGKMASAVNPYGDGKASERIVSLCYTYAFLAGK